MNPNLLKKLKTWRDETAKKEGVENFRVLPNKSIEDIVRMEPKTREELTNIKGIKDRKYYKYGKEILDIVKSEFIEPEKKEQEVFFGNMSLKELQDRHDNFSSYSNAGNKTKEKQEDKIYSVGEFLDHLNNKLISEESKIKGEITSFDRREKVIYFSLKDKDGESVINCLIFRYQYEVSGVELEIGKEIIAFGHPEIYKPTGRLSLKTSYIEIVGEGALKKAYEKLKKKLDEEGLFSLERKKSLPKLPETIGLITSNQGAAIGDFTTNLGNYGFKIKFINSSVEGKQAVFELIDAVKQFKKIKGIDVLAIIRGGGSLESLQAFNNEALVREIARLEIPIVCGVGHEKDISLVSLVSDLAVSTPTAAARAVRESWERAFQKLGYGEKTIIGGFEKTLHNSKFRIETLSSSLKSDFDEIFYKFENIMTKLRENIQKISASLHNSKKNISLYKSRIFSEYERMLIFTKDRIATIQNRININSPERQLSLGYSIASSGGKIIRSVAQVKNNDIIDIRVSDGKIESRVEKVRKSF